MSFPRWTISFLGYPLGGFAAFLLVGSVVDPLTAAAAGLVAGTVIGAAQWLALGRAAGWRWLAASAVGMAAGSAIGAAVTGAATDIPSLFVFGLITGALVGLAQAVTARWSRITIVVWTLALSIAWGVAWIISAMVITTSAALGFVVFGASGALLVMVVTGLLLRRILGAVRAAATPATPAPVGVGAR
jgi:hypothetical protein